MPARKSLYYDIRNSSVIKLSEKLPPPHAAVKDRNTHLSTKWITGGNWELVIIWPNPKDSRFRGASAQFNGRPIGLLI
jgi:hypothetical protein